MVPLAPAALGYTYGFLKASAFATSGASFDLGDELVGVASEELLYRVGIERLLLRNLLGLSEWPARLIQAALFGAVHRNALEAGIAGIAYSWLYEQGQKRGGHAAGFALSGLTHLAHNWGVTHGAP